MQYRREDPKFQDDKRETIRPDRAEFYASFYDHGAPEGFDLEWIFDRYQTCENQR